MGNKKDIGKVFKEHLKDFEQAPDTALWDSIASELDRKGNSRIAPLWYFFGGFLILGLIGSIWFFVGNSDQTPKKENLVETPHNSEHHVENISDPLTTNYSTTNTQSTEKATLPSKPHEANITELENSTKTGVQTTQNTHTKTLKTASRINNNTTLPVTPTGTTPTPANSNQALQTNTKSARNQNNGTSALTPAGVAAVTTSSNRDTTPSSHNEDTASSSQATPKKTTPTTSATGIPKQHNTSNQSKTPSPEKGKHTTAIVTATNVEPSTTPVVTPQSQVGSTQDSLKKENTITTLSKKEKLALQKTQAKAERENKVIEQRKKKEEEIAERLAANQKKREEKTKPASTVKKITQKDTIVVPEEEIIVENSESEKFQITLSPYISLLSYGSLSNASPLDSRLLENPRQSESTIGYGINVEYTLSESTRLRLGIGYAPLKYRTDDYQVTLSSDSTNINIYDLETVSGQAFNQSNTTTENSPEAVAFFKANEVVSIEQNISYLEIPLDFQYMFINKRVSFSISPGVSLFLLDDSSIFATTENGQRFFLGKENNLNQLSLGFNMGLGTHYTINDRWRLNLEPSFRYQLNPYKNPTSDFKPFYFGIQFGMSYKF